MVVAADRHNKIQQNKERTLVGDRNALLEQFILHLAPKVVYKNLLAGK